MLVLFKGKTKDMSDKLAILRKAEHLTVKELVRLQGLKEGK